MRYGLEPPIRVPADLAIFPNFVSWRLARIRSVPVVYDLAFMRHPEFIERSNLHFLRSTLRRTLDRAWRVVTPSRYTSQELTGLTGFPTERIVVAPPPLGAPFRTRLARPVQSSQLAGTTVKPYLLFVGTLEPRKNVDGLIRAFCSTEVARQNRLRLVLAGAFGWRTEPIRQAIARACAEGFSVEVRGRVDDARLVDLYAGAQATILPSHDEGFGLPVIEAMACGCPMIASDAGALPEAAGGAAILVRPGDTGALAAAIDQLGADAAARDRLRAAGLRRAAAFSAGAFTAPWVSLLEAAEA